MLGKITLAPAPVNAQIFHQKTGHHHAQTVVHVAGLVDLHHGCVHQGVAGAALTPGVKQFVGVGAMLPLDGVVIGLEAARHRMGKVGHDLCIKIPPDQLRQPHLCPFIARLREVIGLAGQMPDRHRAKPQMHTQVAWPFDGRVVSGVIVFGDPRPKVLQQGRHSRAAGLNMQGFQVGGCKTQFGQARHALAVGHWPRGQCAGVRLQRMGLEVMVVHLFEPSVFVGREYAVGPSHLGHELLPLENHMVFVGVQGNAEIGQSPSHLGVACQRGRLVVVVGKHRLNTQLMGQLGQFFPCFAMANDQTRAFEACQSPQLRVQIDQRLADEFDPAVSPRQGRQNIGVKDKYTMDFGAIFQRMEERGVVVRSQIAAKPDQSGGKSFVHGRVSLSFHLRQGTSPLKCQYVA